MTPAEFKAARLACGLSQLEWSIAIGYKSDNPDPTRRRERLRQQTHDIEAGRKGITPIVARLAEMYRRYGVPADMLAGKDAVPGPNY